MLEDRIKGLHKEMIFLKDIFLAHASSQHNMTSLDPDVMSILEEDNEQWYQGSPLNMNMDLLTTTFVLSL